SSQPQAQKSWSRCPADAGEVRSPLFQGADERLPRRGGDRRGGATAYDEVRGDEDRLFAIPIPSANPLFLAGVGIHVRFRSRAACSHKTCHVELDAASACSIARTGVAPIPALSSTTGRSPDCRMKLPRGELTSRASPTRTCSRR